MGRNGKGDAYCAREARRLRPDFVGAHRVLTAAAAMTDQTEIASKALEELRRVQPNVSLSWLANEMPFRANAERDNYLEAFRRAGLE